MALGAATLGKLIVAIGADTTGLDKGLGNATTKVSLFGKTATADMQMVGKAALGVGAAMLAGSALIVGASAKLGMEFQQGLMDAVAVAGGGMAEFEKEARRIGAATERTALEATIALKNFAAAGFGVKGSLLAAAPAVDLAIATTTDLNTVSKLLSSSLIAMGADFEDAREFVDVFAVAHANSAANVNLLREAMKDAGSTGRALGWTIQDTVAAVSSFADAGFEGSRAGNLVKMTMNTLAAQTDKSKNALERIGVTFSEIDPQMHDFGSIVQRLAESDLVKIADASDIFGKRAGAAMLALVKNAREGKFRFAELTDEMAKAQGQAERMRKMMEDTVAGQLKKLLSAIQEVGLSIFDLIKEPLKELLISLTELAVKIGEFIKNNQFLVMVIGMVTVALGALLVALGGLILISPAVAAAVFLMTGPFGIMIGVIAALVVVLAVLVGATVAFALAWRTNLGNIQEYTMGTVLEIQRSLQLLAIEFAGFWTAIARFISTAISEGMRLGSKALKDGLNIMITSMRSFANKIKEAWSRLGSAVASALKGDFDAARDHGNAAALALASGVGSVYGGLTETVKNFGQVWTDTWKNAGKVFTDTQVDMNEILRETNGEYDAMIDNLARAIVEGDKQAGTLDEIRKKLEALFEPVDTDVTGGAGAKETDPYKAQREAAARLVDEIQAMNAEFLSDDERKYQELLNNLDTYHDMIDEKTGERILKEEEYQKALLALDRWRIDSLIEDIEAYHETDLEKEQEQFDKQLELLNLYWEQYKETDLINQEEYDELRAAIEDERALKLEERLRKQIGVYDIFFNNLSRLTGNWGNQQTATMIKTVGAWTTGLAKIFTFYGMVQRGEMKMDAITESVKGFKALARYDFAGAASHFSASALAVSAVTEILGIMASLPKAEKGAVIQTHPGEVIVPFERMGEAFNMWKKGGGLSDDEEFGGEVTVNNYIDSINGTSDAQEVADEIGESVASALGRA